MQEQVYGQVPHGQLPDGTSSCRCPENRGRNWLNLAPESSELMPAKAHCETGRPATNDVAHCNQLNRNATVQVRRPLDTQFQFLAHAEFMLGSDQRATTAQIYSLANARMKPSAQSAVTDV
jgi:hypothetical protein